MASECYDVIITGAGGGTLAYRLSTSQAHPATKPSEEPAGNHSDGDRA